MSSDGSWKKLMWLNCINHYLFSQNTVEFCGAKKTRCLLGYIVFPTSILKKILRIWLHAQLYPHLGWSDPHFGWLDPYSKSFWMSLAPIFNTFWQIRFRRYGNSHRSLTNLALIPHWKRLAKNSYMVEKKHRPNGFTFQVCFKQEGQHPVGSDAIGVLVLVVPRWENLFECVAVWHLCRTWLRDPGIEFRKLEDQSGHEGWFFFMKKQTCSTCKVHSAMTTCHLPISRGAGQFPLHTQLCVQPSQALRIGWTLLSVAQ